MRVQIRRHHIESCKELDQQILRHMYFALGRFSNDVRSAGVHLTDTNGPRGGADKECRILVNMRSGDPVVIREIDVQIHAAVARAAERAGRAVARQISLRRDGNGNGSRRGR